MFHFYTPAEESASAKWSTGLVFAFASRYRDEVEKLTTIRKTDLLAPQGR